MNVKSILFCTFFLVISSCQQSTKIDNDSLTKVKRKISKTSEEKNEDVYTFKTFFSPDLGWGYQILNNGNMYINQPHIPAIEGVKGFSNENSAIITAELMIYKLKNGIFPPTISLEELDSLGVLNE